MVKLYLVLSLAIKMTVHFS